MKFVQFLLIMIYLTHVLIISYKIFTEYVLKKNI
jgi:hypothetical protein